MASDILSYNVVQDHEGISIKGYRGLRPQGDLIYSDLHLQAICPPKHTNPRFQHRKVYGIKYHILILMSVQ